VARRGAGSSIDMSTTASLTAQALEPLARGGRLGGQRRSRRHVEELPAPRRAPSPCARIGRRRSQSTAIIVIDMQNDFVQGGWSTFVRLHSGSRADQTATRPAAVLRTPRFPSSGQLGNRPDLLKCRRSNPSLQAMAWESPGENCRHGAHVLEKDSWPRRSWTTQPLADDTMVENTGSAVLDTRSTVSEESRHPYDPFTGVTPSCVLSLTDAIPRYGCIMIEMLRDDVARVLHEATLGRKKCYGSSPIQGLMAAAPPQDA